jgi:sporulation protein YlmC with PRC-barrel domain
MCVDSKILAALGDSCAKRAFMHPKSVLDVIADTQQHKRCVMATLDNLTDTGGRLIAASKVNGTAVYNPAGDKLGSIYDVMLDKISGHAEYAIMSFGGFLGIGDSYHPLPWNALKYDVGMGGYVVNLTREQLEGAPSYTASEQVAWDDDVWPNRVRDYYSPLL